jgi:DNA-binding MarR family transcriptional regulator
VVRIGITSAGLALLASIDEPMLALHRLQFAVLSPKQLAAFTRMARRLYES